jgi:hypothetical protein
VPASNEELRGTLEAIDRILNRGGDADDVLRAVLDALSRLYPYSAIAFVEEGELIVGPEAGAREAESVATFPISFRDTSVGELRVSGSSDEPEERAFLERVALLISPYCLVGWDTGGVPWSEVS